MTRMRGRKLCFRCGRHLRARRRSWPAQVPLCVAGLLLVCRQALLIAANLTTNELLNRQRYTYLRHELAGYSNR
jgi:hypothetical protein